MNTDGGSGATTDDGFTALSATEDDEERRNLRNDLVRRHMGLSVSLARRFSHRGIPDDDLIQVANVGLVNAVDRFDPSLGYEFATFATPTILGEIKRHFRDRGWAVRIPRRLQELNLRLNTVSGDLAHRLGRSPTIAELAAATNTSEEDVLEALDAARAYRYRSTDAWSDDEDRADLELGGDDPDLPRIEARLLVEHLVGGLNRRDRLIIDLRFHQEMSQQEIADRLGVSQMQVSRLLRRVLDTLRAEMGDDVGI
ncbi:MAG: SigB/SigF/SigG family RNA polymerase sigma factor [Microthrixaceae bacterium]|nr:SigB/SigF/SigG family RNA polymerase sigma factor [Acidimicrobiales bacterium]MCB9403112.1 SigB/SigF/SigG family RNA polymerase sigma factor [Microthrixaceae bacterium]